MKRYPLPSNQIKGDARALKLEVTNAVSTLALPQVSKALILTNIGSAIGYFTLDGTDPTVAESFPLAVNQTLTIEGQFETLKAISGTTSDFRVLLVY
jgi:hypothetical protein